MLRFNKLLGLLVLGVLVSPFFWGCEQPEDVLTPASETDMWLDESLLPSNPDGMIYEFWVADGSDTVSLGKFGYDFVTQVYEDADGNERADSNKFVITADIYSYTSIFVSVETIPDSDPLSPGPIMLIEDLSSPTLVMKFPLVDTLWSGTVRYGMQSTSDDTTSSDDTTAVNTLTNGHAVWFATYERMTEDVADTTGGLSWSIQNLSIANTIYIVDTSYTIDTLGDTIWEYDTVDVILSVDTLISGIVDSTIHVVDTALIRGLDTIIQQVIRYEVDTVIESLPGHWLTKLVVEYDTAYIFEKEIVYDYFAPDEFGLPEIAPYGWKYKGWVVAPQIPASVLGQVTMPSWKLFGPEVAEMDGGLLTTGKFTDIKVADESNPYVASDRVPPVPGEDFLANLPIGLDSVNLCPNEDWEGTNPGRVFVTLEPDNFVTDTTNFPLLAFIGTFPVSRSEVVDSTIQQFTIRGWMGNDGYRGFPLITVNVERF